MIGFYFRAQGSVIGLLAGGLALSGCTKSASSDVSPSPSAVASQAQAVQSSIASAQAAHDDPPPHGEPTHAHPSEANVDAPSTSQGPRMNAEDMASAGKMRLLGHPPATNAAGGLPPGIGAPHLYHVGAEGFFLEHATALGLSVDQQAKLSVVKEKAELAYAATQRKLDEAENDLWILTSAETPDVVKIDGKISEIGRLTAQQRMDRVRAVGSAVAVLSEAQRKAVVALGPSFTPPAASAASTNAPSGGMMMGDDAMKMGGGMKMGGSNGMGQSAPKSSSAPMGSMAGSGPSQGMGHM